MKSNNSTPDVSIIMPVYNSIDFLDDSVGDILRQTYTCFELICIDDGSTDGSGGVLDNYSNIDSRIRVIHQENAGGGAARNKGLREAKGEYIIFLDSDDRFEPELIEKVYNVAAENNTDIVAYNGDVFDYATKNRSSAPWLLKSSEDINIDNPFLVLNTSVWNKMFRKEYLYTYDIVFQENRIVDTMSFVFLAIIYAKKISVLREILIHYRTNNENSIISNSDKYPTEAFEAFLFIKRKLENDNLFEKKKTVFASYCVEYMLNRLDIMKTSYGFSRLYTKIHDEFSKLGVQDTIEENRFLESNNKRRLENILNNNVDKYLFEREMKLQDIGILRKEIYLLPMPIQDKRIKGIIYGAGNVGKDYFMQINKRNDIDLIGWMDSKFKTIGFPIQAPEHLIKMEYDIIIIAVAFESIADSIRKGLLEMGIPECKIYWEQPIVL